MPHDRDLIFETQLRIITDVLERLDFLLGKLKYRGVQSRTLPEVLTVLVLPVDKSGDEFPGCCIGNPSDDFPQKAFHEHPSRLLLYNPARAEVEQVFSAQARDGRRVAGFD